MIYTACGDVENFTIDGRCYAGEWEAEGTFDNEDGFTIGLFTLYNVWEVSGSGADTSEIDRDVLIKIAMSYRDKHEEHIKSRLLLAKLDVQEDYQEFDRDD